MNSQPAPQPYTPPRPALAVRGPRWVANATARAYSWDGPVGGTQQTDGRGTTWTCTSVEQGGRVLRWVAASGAVARTECTPDHPDYPTDDQLAARARDRRRTEKVNRRR